MMRTTALPGPNDKYHTEKIDKQKYNETLFFDRSPQILQVKM